MPELVEVEVIARNLRRWLVGRDVLRVELLRPELLRGGSIADLRDIVISAGPLGIHRRGKALLLVGRGERGALLRFGMTGKIVREGTPGGRKGARLRAYIGPPGGPEQESLAFMDARNLGSISLVDLAAWGGAEACLRGAVPGEDAWEDPPDGAQVAAMLAGSRSPVRVRLMDQSLIAGIGNILVTEILFEAGVDPATPSREVSARGALTIAEAIPRVIGRVLDLEASEEIRYLGEAGATNPFGVYGRGGEPCPRCGGILLRQVIGGRASVACPSCQPRLGAP